MKIKQKQRPWPQNLLESALQFNDQYLSEIEKISEKDVEFAMQNILSPQEQQILFILYKEGKTLQAAGDIFGITRERIRQIRNKALFKLHNPWCISIMLNGAEAHKKNKLHNAKEALSLAKQYGYPFSAEDCNLSLDSLKELPLNVRNIFHRKNIETLGDLLAWKFLDSPALDVPQYAQEKLNHYVDATISEFRNQIEDAYGNQLQQGVDKFKLSSRTKNALVKYYGQYPTLLDIAFTGARKIFYIPNIGCKSFCEIMRLMTDAKLDRNSGYAWPTAEDIEGEEMGKLYRKISETLESTGGSHVPTQINVIRKNSEKLCRIFPSTLCLGDTVFHDSSPRVVGSIVWGENACIVSRGIQYPIAELQ